MSEEHAQGAVPAPKPHTIHQDLNEALDQLEAAVNTHVTNQLFRDLADKAVEVVRKIVEAHVKV